MHIYVYIDDPHIGGAGMDDAAHFRDEPTDGRGNSRRRISIEGCFELLQLWQWKILP